MITLAVGVVAFGLVINRYNLLVRTKNRLTFLKHINEREVLIQQRKLNGIDSGAEFLNADHAYAVDLDIFGQHSLFQILNRTTTEPGKMQLASWLMRPAEPDLILERQKAAAELAPKIDWRQEFQAAGMPFLNPKSSYVQLIKWIDAPADLLPQRRRYLISAIVLGLVATLAAALAIRHLFLFLFLNEPFSVVLILPIIVSLIVNRQVIKRMRANTERTLNDLQYCVPMLAASESLISLIESASLDSELLQKWQSVFRIKEYSAVSEILRLRKTLEAFQQRGSRQLIGKNDFYGIFNSIWLLDIYFILSTELWKAKNGSKIKEWSTAIGNFEAISSLAGFTYANPEFVLPSIAEDNYRIRFKGLGHPLLKQQQRICNDFELVEKGSVVIITGSNMAGKSTFLRTVGCNLVLAMIGGPCCALSGQISPVHLFTSMRTQDNLEEGISSFYAELKRIEMLLKLIASGQPVFFLLDEMFKGTNSDDRYKGGVSLIRQLSALNAFGMISTHDLQLAKVASQRLPVRNYSFNSELLDEKIIFNYKLTEGFCTDFNASALMKKSGIDILEEGIWMQSPLTPDNFI
ncbi:DNA mismatch repair protein MutS [Dyadobacter sp. LJ53]|uniref:MutS-related protein n=1 Tax=Dyadobacter chenwenxiniae TaxID=2906456 RepID=UPI001F37F947|nr:DNA mismatch repair protein MutS [Dyadobacter chenwenxiniae]MCF0048487.1 DNA mismatch repair protein MutS [Dyadobacter chenwenxiniae]